MAEARYGRKNRYDDIRRVCEGAVSIPFSDYIEFLERCGYLHHDKDSEGLAITPVGESIVNGDRLSELTERATSHFNMRKKSEPKKTALPTVTRSHSSAVSRSVSTREVREDRDDGGSTLFDNRYQKLAQLGSGGIGTVYRARHVPLNREVALKECKEIFAFFTDGQKDEIVRRFIDVIRASAGISHPNIMPIHEVNFEAEFPYLVSELAPSGSMRRLINEADEIPVALALKYLLQTLHALRAAHGQRVFHRGLKPEQLLLDAYGNVKVSDFGFSRIVERDSAVIRQVYVGMGNIAYMAPEVYSDPTGAGSQADIYSLGIIFYELLTRRLPGRRSPMPSEVVKGLPKELDDIFDKMTRDSRSERYPSVDDILDDIDKLDLTEVLGRQTLLVVAENPLDAIQKKTPANGGVPVTAASEEDTQTLEAGTTGEEGEARKTHRPYSFQSRRKRNP